MSKRATIVISLVACLLLLILVSYYQRRIVDAPGHIQTHSPTPSKEQKTTNITPGSNKSTEAAENPPGFPSSKKNKAMSPPDPQADSEPDRIWGEVVASGQNKHFQIKFHANAVCQVLPNTPSKIYLTRNGGDPVRPISGSSIKWPDGVAIKIRDNTKTGEILGARYFSSGWMNPNWGGSGYLVRNDLVPMSSNGLDLVELMKSLAHRTRGEVSESMDTSKLEFKLKVILSEEIFDSDGSLIPRSDIPDFETDWIDGRYLKP